jgi:hypothetical protein
MNGHIVLKNTVFNNSDLEEGCLKENSFRTASGFRLLNESTNKSQPSILGFERV